MAEGDGGDKAGQGVPDIDAHKERHDGFQSQVKQKI